MNCNKLERDCSIDFARSVAIILVLFWHLKPFQIVKISSGNETSIIKTIFKIFYEQITLTAVPLFLLISLLLFLSKYSEDNKSYLKKRIVRLTVLFSFWTLIQFCAFYALSFLLMMARNEHITWPEIDKSISYLLMNGGPPLPYVGALVFYFIFVLICLTIILYLLNKLNNISMTCKLSYVLIFLHLLYFIMLNYTGKGIPYWRIDNFFIYIPIAYIVYHSKLTISIRMVVMMWLIYICSVGLDLFIRHTIGGTGVYSRPSVVFGSLAIFSIIKCKINNPIPKLLNFFSKFSLGLFAIHKYVQFLTNFLYKNYTVTLGKTTVSISALLAATTCTVATCVIVFIISKTRFEWAVK